MGSRLSMPRGPGGTTESSHLARSPANPSPRHPLRRVPFTSRQLMAPMAAFTMACLLFVYTRTSIKAAKENAKRHRDADSGGEGLNLLKESRRRHGRAEQVEDTKGGTIGELGRALIGKGGGAQKKGSDERSEEEERLRAAMGRRGKE